MKATSLNMMNLDEKWMSGRGDLPGRPYYNKNTIILHVTIGGKPFLSKLPAQRLIGVFLTTVSSCQRVVPI